MRQVTVYTTYKEYSHFLELAKNLHYVKKIETDGEPTKEEILDNIKTIKNLQATETQKRDFKTFVTLFKNLLVQLDFHFIMVVLLRFEVNFLMFNNINYFLNFPF